MSFTFNDEFFSELGASPAVIDLTTAAAEKVLAASKASAPVATGGYKRSLHLETRQKKYRRQVVVVADADDALLVESRTGNLARALRSASRS